MKTFTLLVIALLFPLAVFAQDFNEVIKIEASDSSPEDEFGWSLDISGNYAIVGAWGEDEDAAGNNTLDDAGSVYIIERDNYGNWNEVHKIVASDRAANNRFGISVGISGNYAVVGAQLEDEDASGENTLEDAGSAYIFERDGYGNWNEVQKIVASDRARWHEFGGSVSISGSYAIIGAISDDDMNPLIGAGSAYIFTRDDNGNWNEVQKIVASDRAAGDCLGFSLGISGNYAVVGAKTEDEDPQGENTMEDAGSAYIFECDEGGTWNEIQKIAASDRDVDDWFGNSVSISGKYVIVSAPYEDEDASGGNTLDDAGSVYIFERNESGVWNEVQKIVASDRAMNDCFGNSLSLSGDYAIVGAYMEDEDAEGENTLDWAGSEYIFKRDAGGTWNEIRKIVASDRAEENNFGFASGISGNYAMIGQCHIAGRATGTAYIFEACTPGTDPDPDNILENGNFEACILSPWSLYNADYLGVTANAVLMDGECTVSGINLSNSPVHWDIQLKQELSIPQIERLEVDSTYVISFEASAEADDRPCRISFEQSIDPWANILEEYAMMGTETETCSYEFVLNAVYPDIQLSLQLGTNVTPVTFDNVRLVKKVGGSPSAVNNMKRDEWQIFPNPASEYLNVNAENGAVVKLYNNMGLLVKSGIPVSNRLSFNVSDLPAGIYIVEINNGRNVSAGKVIIY